MKTLLTTMLFSLITMAATTVKTGVIREITCNGPSGLGFIRLENVKGKTMTYDFIKVNSYKLCGAKPREFSYLGSYAYDAVFLGEVYKFQLTIQDGFIVDLKKLDKIDYMKFTNKVRNWTQRNNPEVHQWWFKGPTYIDYHTSKEDVLRLVEEYTSKDFLSSL